jgi:dTMP kinase
MTASGSSLASLPKAGGRRGRFIVLEGVDGAGTTTQRERLGSWLASLGHAVHATAEPSVGPVGKLIRSLLNPDSGPFAPEAMALLFAADRRDHIAREIEPQLQAGAVVLSDRYVLSSLAYQTAAGVPRELVYSANFGGSGLLIPDLTLLVEVTGEVSAQRRAKRAGAVEIYDDRLIQERVAAAYRRETELWIATGTGPAQIIDGTGTPDEVEDLLRSAIAPLLLL